MNTYLLESDTVLWRNNNNISNVLIKYTLYSHMHNLSWTDLIQFKGHGINLSIFTVMDVHKGLKTSDNFKARGFGTVFPYFFCHTSPKSHNHIFFDCPLTGNILREVLPYGNYFLLAPTLIQVLQHDNNLSHKIT